MKFHPTPGQDKCQLCGESRKYHGPDDACQARAADAALRNGLLANIEAKDRGVSPEAVALLKNAPLQAEVAKRFGLAPAGNVGAVNESA